MSKLLLFITLVTIPPALASLDRNGFPLTGGMQSRATYMQKRYPLGSIQLLDKRCDGDGLVCYKGSADCCNGSCTKDCNSGQFVCGGECGGKPGNCGPQDAGCGSNSDCCTGQSLSCQPNCYGLAQCSSEPYSCGKEPPYGYCECYGVGDCDYNSKKCQGYAYCGFADGHGAKFCCASGDVNGC